MLVIRRRPGETLMIGDEVEIEVLETSGSQVKLGIRAPKNIPVARKEIYLTSRQNHAASQSYSGAAVERLLRQLPAPRVQSSSVCSDKHA